MNLRMTNAQAIAATSLEELWLQRWREFLAKRGLRYSWINDPLRNVAIAPPPSPQYKFDFAWKAYIGAICIRDDTGVLVELDGGAYRRRKGQPAGAHNTPAAMVRDARKANLAASLGWKLFRVVGTQNPKNPLMLDDEPTMAMILQAILEGEQ